MAQRTANKTTAPELLRQQHDNVKKMFSEMERARGKERQELFDCLRKTLAVHETAEEMIIYPELRSINKTAASVADARVQEESEAKKVLSELEKLGTDDAKFDEQFAEFRSAVLEHATNEELNVFPMLEQHCEGSKLVDMGDLILTAESMAPTHPHPHGPESAMGNLLVGPFVAMVDKVRDKIAEHQKR